MDIAAEVDVLRQNFNFYMDYPARVEWARKLAKFTEPILRETFDYFMDHKEKMPPFARFRAKCEQLRQSYSGNEGDRGIDWSQYNERVKERWLKFKDGQALWHFSSGRYNEVIVVDDGGAVKLITNVHVEGTPLKLQYGRNLLDELRKNADILEENPEGQ